PINWLRFVMLVSPEQKPVDGQQTEAQKDFERMDGWFKQSPDCAGNYMDGTSAGCTTTWEYRRDHLYAFSDPLMYQTGVNRPCGNGMASVIRTMDAYRKRYFDKLTFGNVWASNRMFPMCMALDVPGYESSRWSDLPYADYYRAAAYHKPGLYLNYFRIGQQLDTREGGERFFRYATAYGIFPSIGRFTDEAYEKFGDLQHLYIPIIKRLFRAGWEPETYATTNDPAIRVERFGRALNVHYFTVLNPTGNPRVVKLTLEGAAFPVWAADLPDRDLAAVEMSTSAALPLQRSGEGWTTSVPLGPQDVAVVALMPQTSLGTWYRGRARELLEGASYVYASTPSTNATALLAKQVPAVAKKLTPAQTARRTNEIIGAVSALDLASASLPDDLKRRSYRRDLAEAQRLLTEALLADAGVEVGWMGQPGAAMDGQVSLSPWLMERTVRMTGGGPPETTAVKMLGSVRERLVEPEVATMVQAPQTPLTLGLEDRAKSAVTALATISFKDAAGQSHDLQRRGYAYFGAISELTATYEPASGALAVRLRNADVRPRQFDLALSAATGLQ
ncbi:MAG: hypothetical protein WCP21_21645, partial [Armatimonadota bacterium]